MGKSLFLTGDSGEGKTTLLFQCLMPYRSFVSGFYSQRLIDKNQNTVGFRLASAKEEWKPKAYYEEALTNVFLRRENGNTLTFPEVFLTAGSKLLKNHENEKLILMDEIGGVELLIPEFMEAIHQCFNGPTPCIGVVKSHKNLALMTKKSGGNLSLEPLLTKLEEEFLKDQKNRILTYKRSLKEEISTEVLDFLKQNTGRERLG